MNIPNTRPVCNVCDRPATARIGHKSEGQWTGHSQYACPDHILTVLELGASGPGVRVARVAP